MTYKDSKIFKITVNNCIFIGSTVQPLKMRFNSLICESRDLKKQNKPLFKTINSPPNKWTEINIELIKNFPTDSMRELHEETRKYILLYGSLNAKIPLRTKQEYAFDNKEKVRRWNRVYHQITNKEAYLQYQREYAEEKEKCMYCSSCAKQGLRMRIHLMNYHFDDVMIDYLNEDGII
jgi:excinuclease UvrABC ATPase subunit